MEHSKAPTRVVVYQGRRLQLLAFGVIIAMLVWSAVGDEKLEWTDFVIFGGVVLSALLTFAGVDAKSLTLDADGFYIHDSQQQRSFYWFQVERFGVGVLGRKERVFFDFVGGRRPFTSGDSPSPAGMLPHTYGHTAEDLVSLLEDWRQGRPRQPTPSNVYSRFKRWVINVARRR